MPLLEDIETLLIGIESNIFIGEMPDSKKVNGNDVNIDNAIAIYNTGGFNPEHTMDGGKISNPTFQIIVRDESYPNGITRCEAILNVLDMVTNQNINGHFYLGIFQQGDILSLGRDSKNRIKFSLNFKAKI